MLQILPATMAAPLALATPENDWRDLFWRYIPQWLAISDERALEGYVRGVKKGEPSLYLPRNIEAWLMPVLAWSAFVVVLMFVMLCINIIIRKQWTDREKLTYPIAQLPFEMTKPGTRLFSSRLFWLRFSFVGLIGIINGLSFFFPNVPYLRNSPPFDLAVYFTTKPWNALGKTALLIRPFILGLVFLIPLDIAFSFWFFFFFWKAQLISASALG